VNREIRGRENKVAEKAVLVNTASAVSEHLDLWKCALYSMLRRLGEFVHWDISRGDIDVQHAIYEAL
jgi:hypothetical protein